MTARSREEERTGFQEGRPFGGAYDLQTDFVMAYGIGESMPERVRRWKEAGYVVHLMTGVSWGNYVDYLDGRFDGRSHWDEAQTDKNGERIIHGTSAHIPYMIPTLSYADFLVESIRPAVDAGVEAIHLEEPEIWVEDGYSEAFKREWRIYYGEEWQPPHGSVDAQYRASKLKSFLYTRCLDRICSALKEYSLVRYGRPLRFFVPTHSLINYTQWRIVSPESRLLELPSVDGYIAQVWTGTSRTANVYEGRRAERTFETAFLEYGIMQELTRGTGRRMWFLHDPIEDDPKRTWTDYRTNYVKTLIASLLHPGVSHYEVAPWPRRIFEGRYAGDDGVKTGIPGDYATILLTLMHALGNMADQPLSDGSGGNGGEVGGGARAGVLLADSAMFQRMRIGKETAGFLLKYDGTNEGGIAEKNATATELLDFSDFYGLTLPLVKHGLPVRPVQLDNVRRFPGYLDDYRLLVLSYEFMKPEHPDLHATLAQWVREGGTLLYVGDDRDPYHRVREWWNAGRRKYENPREHLFECLGLSGDSPEGLTRVGDGAVLFLREAPSRLAGSRDGAERLRRSAAELLAFAGGEWEPNNAFRLQRGPYVIVSVMEESVHDRPVRLEGRYVNLLDRALPIVREFEVRPGEQGLLYDLDAEDAGGGEIVAASSRIERFEANADGISFTAKGPLELAAVARIRCPFRPASASVPEGDRASEPVPFEWDEETGTLLLRYEHRPDGVRIRVSAS
ncbi:hypothetical protein [Cohnella zeiphila]|uniref:Beta-galactosidase trimerisation domain-containing protein n=1 Tax=Cohnella zeiphila TaxID=2761120 RepID=A0A7X0SNW2_9BACL|nr:hypothetical protein [Cohnella zeiphila]MBB6733286.1 hypothetical protein [Cohnella zeiphila]